MQISHGSQNSMGMELMRRIADGDLKKAPAEIVEKVKREITDNCEELIEIGARIRPLMSGDKQIGWVRGIHTQERRILKRWVREPNDYIALTLLHATSLNKEEIESMQGFEIRSLTEVIRQMSNYDVSLFPYLNAYVTTQSSETLWYGKGERLASFENKIITLPDSKIINLMAPPDHSSMWVTLCNYREQAKKRLEENMNALFIVRPWAGNSADPIANELKGVARSLETNSDELWEKVVSVPKEVNKNDGWGHVGDSVEDLKREMKGMMEGDKHEKVIEAWQSQMIDEAEAKKQEIEKIRKDRGITAAGINFETTVIMTDQQVRERQQALREGRSPNPPPSKRENFEQDATNGMLSKLRSYR